MPHQPRVLETHAEWRSGDVADASAWTEHFDVSRGFKFSTYACRAVLACFHRLGAKERRYRQHVPVQFEPQMQQDDYDQRRHAEQHEPQD